MFFFLLQGYFHPFFSTFSALFTFFFLPHTTGVTNCTKVVTIPLLFVCLSFRALFAAMHDCDCDFSGLPVYNAALRACERGQRPSEAVQLLEIMEAESSGAEVDVSTLRRLLHRNDDGGRGDRGEGSSDNSSAKSQFRGVEDDSATTTKPTSEPILGSRP